MCTLTQSNLTHQYFYTLLHHGDTESSIINTQRGLLATVEEIVHCFRLNNVTMSILTKPRSRVMVEPRKLKINL